MNKVISFAWVILSFMLLIVFPSCQMKNKKAMALIGQGAEKYQQGSVRSAIIDLGEAIKLNPRNELKATAYYARSVAFNDLKEYSKAKYDVVMAIAIVPTDDDYWYLLGGIQSNMDNYPDAIKSLTKAIDLNSQNAKALYLRGILYREMDELGYACADWRKARLLGSEEARSSYEIWCK